MKSSSTPEKKYPALFQFLAGYFNQDFDLDYRDTTAAVDAYLRETSKDAVSKAREELCDAIRTSDIESLDDFLLSMGCYYVPEDDGVPAAEWLNFLKQRLDYNDVSNEKPGQD